MNAKLSRLSALTEFNRRSMERSKLSGRAREQAEEIERLTKERTKLQRQIERREAEIAAKPKKLSREEFIAKGLGGAGALYLHNLRAFAKQ